MRRYDKRKNIQRLNESLNNKKTNLTEGFGESEGKEYYDHILQGHEATEENAYDHARGIDWMDVETSRQNLPNLNFIDNVNGVEIYYDHGADYYCFSPAEIEEARQPQMVNHSNGITGPGNRIGETKEKPFNLLNETSKTMFDKLCGVKIIKEGSEGTNEIV